MNCTWELQGFKPFWYNLHHQSNTLFIRKKGGGFFPNMGHVSVMNTKQVYDKKLIPFALTTYIFWLMEVTCP
jgi:hypothetical protein